MKRMVIHTKEKIPLLILSPEKNDRKITLLWFHGGGYFLGMKEMIFISPVLKLVKDFGFTLVVPGYRMALLHPYPTPLRDAYSSLMYLKNNAEALGLDKNKIVVGGESSGGGLALALSLLARDRGENVIKGLFPLYPMIDYRDTESSRDNHGKVWNTRLNHLGWKIYLRKTKDITKYASPALETDYSNLPPLYSFVGTGEPFYDETVELVKSNNNSGSSATLDIYDTNIHAFDMLHPHLEISKTAREKLIFAILAITSDL